MKVQNVFLGRQELGADTDLDGKLIMLADNLFGNIGGRLMYGIYKTDLYEHNNIRVMNTGGTSAQGRTQLFQRSCNESR